MTGEKIYVIPKTFGWDDGGFLNLIAISFLLLKELLCFGNPAQKNKLLGRNGH
jgi:hypothetical protein